MQFRIALGVGVLAFTLGAVAFGACGWPGAAEPPTPTLPPGSFIPVREILASQCAVSRCHNTESLAGRLDLTPERSRGNLVGIRSTQQPAATLVEPGDPPRSYLLSKLRGLVGIRGVRMPLGRTPLAAEEEQVIESWIALGAGSP
jgi:hypothetical protein